MLEKIIKLFKREPEVIYKVRTKKFLNKQAEVDYKRMKEKSNKITITKGTVFIGAGCSHTQGCAFTDNKVKVELHELASDALKEKYGDEKKPSSFITDLSWVGMVGKALKAERVYNFGFGGWGIESVIRAIRNYTFKVKDLKNHIIIIQIPSPTRKEVTIQQSNEKEVTVTNVQSATSFDSKIPYKEAFLDHYVDFEIIEGNMINELYFLQDYLESKGAVVRFFDHPFDDWAIQTTNQNETYQYGYREWTNKSYHKYETEMIDLPDLYNSLNLLDLSDFYNYDETAKEVVENDGTLHREGLLQGDMHYSELGNQRLSKKIVERMEAPFSERLFATLPSHWEVNRKKKLI